MDKNEPVEQHQYRIISTDGTEKTLFSTQPLISDNENAINLDDIILESRAFKKSQQLSIEKEAILNAISDAIVFTDTDRRIISINLALEKMFGYNIEQLSGHTTSILYESEAEYLAQGEIRFNLLKSKTINSDDRYEVKYQRKNGDIFIGETLGKSIKNVAGTIIGFIGVIRDMSETKNIEQALENSQINLFDILQHSRDLSYKFNFESKVYDYISHNAEQVLGFSTKECSEMDFYSAKNRIHPEDLPAYKQSISKLKAAINSTISDTVIEYRWRHKDGKYHWYSDNATILFNDKKEPTAIIGSVRDITEIKKAEIRLKSTQAELQKKRELENIGALAGGLAHDFNNVLTGIFGNIALVKANLADDDPAAKYLLRAEKSKDRATQITGQLLTFAKGGSPRKKAVELLSLIKEKSLFELTGKNILSEFRFPDSEIIAQVDRSQMAQLVTNILSNAVFAMPDGGKIIISIEEIELSDNVVADLAAGSYIKCVFSDTGVGIKKDDLEHIFDPYFSTKTIGSGLGLTTVYSIIKKHDGYVTVDSEPDVGTSLCFYLPAAKPHIRKDVLGPQEGSAAKINRQKKILVMDDDEMILNLLKSMLELKKLSVDTSLNGESALQKYQASIEKSEPYDVVIMDLTIPNGMGGLEAIKELINLDPEVKCIVSSGYADDPIMANFQNYGFKGVINKPFAVAELMDTLDKVFKL